MAVNLQHRMGKTKITDDAEHGANGIDLRAFITFIKLFFEYKLSCKKSVKEKKWRQREKPLQIQFSSQR